MRTYRIPDKGKFPPCETTRRSASIFVTALAAGFVFVVEMVPAGAKDLEEGRFLNDATGVELHLHSVLEDRIYYEFDLRGASSVSGYAGRTGAGAAVATLSSGGEDEEPSGPWTPVKPIGFQHTGTAIQVAEPDGPAHPSGKVKLAGDYRKLDETEMLNRAKAFHQEADRELNLVYREVMGRLSKEEAAELRQAQRDWIEYRDSLAEFSGDEDSHLYWEMAGALTETRVGYLRIYEGRGITPALSGEYIDAFGGQLRIWEQPGGSLRFELSVVRGPTHHLGEIEGVAKPEAPATAAGPRHEKAEAGPRARYVFRGPAIPEEEPAPPFCVVNITPMKPRLLAIEAENCQAYAGARAYFDGTYRKTADHAPAAEPAP